MTAVAETLDNRPPLAPKLPSMNPLGHLPAMADDPFVLFDRARELGDVVRARAAHRDLIFVYSPTAIERIYLHNASNYTKQTRGYHKLRLVLGNGLVTSEGDFWRRQRRIANPAFHKKRIAAFAGVMNTSTRQAADRWADGQRVEMVGEMSRMTLQIAGETLFSTDPSDEANVIGPAINTTLHELERITTAPIPYPEYWPLPGSFRFWRALGTLQGVVDEMIAERRANPGEHLDLLGLFMDAVDEEGQGMSDRQLRDEALTMLTAGHETTAMALTWTLYLLAQHPAVARQLEAEVDALGDKDVGMMDLGKLDLTNRVLKESMRLYPPVWIQGRKAEEDDVLDGYHVPAGSFMYIPAYAVHRHPRLWDNPEAFDPDRWLPERAHKLPRGAYFPFSLGQRKCIGDRFAQMEAAIAVSWLVRRFRFELAPGERVQMEAALTLRPKHGLNMVLRRR